VGKAGDKLSASAWLEALKTTETADRRWKRAVRTLTAMGLPVVPALIEGTGDDHPEVRRGASTALHKIGPAIIPFLIKALRHDNWMVREGAARGLYGFAPKAQKAIPALCEALRDSDAFVRQYVATALERLASIFGPILKVAVPGLTDLLKDDDFVVREWAAHALGSIGASAKAAIPALKEAAMEDVEPSVKESAASAIDEIQKALP
jgi:HEAT repeat protein